MITPPNRHQPISSKGLPTVRLSEFFEAIARKVDENDTLTTQLTSNTAVYTATNVTTDRGFDADTVTVAELADVVGTLIADLKNAGVIQ